MEIIKVALSSLGANRLRSSLTMLGIIVGIFSIISISTIITMLQSSIEEGVSMLGQNTFQIQKWDIIIGGGPQNRARFRNRKDITIEEYVRLKEMLVDAKALGAEQWGFGKILLYGNKETNPNISLSGCTPESFPNNQWSVDKGREFTQNDVDHYQKVVVLGADVAEALFEFVDPIGQEIKVDGHKLKVIGVLEKQGSVFGQSQDNFAVMPITTSQNFYGKRSRSISITVTSVDRNSYEDLIEKAIGAMRTIRKVSAGEENDFGIFSNQSILTQINNITEGVRIGSYVVAAIALLAAGVGIMNIMLVSVTERTKEIGIRKAVGAKKRNVLLQFLVEAVALSLAGGFIGIILGIAAGNLAGSFLEAKAVFPIDWVAIGITLCVIIGVTFGTYPAYKAANLDPIDALRYE
ncbi:MAG: peptide ABC transporter permease [Ignavibacteria bacterium GWB2_35_6b]|nr:MAG: peptide ABC transporter permease [Ignavibacteria bacterium GWB2_35_6b]